MLKQRALINSTQYVFPGVPVFIIAIKHFKNDKYSSLKCDLNISGNCWMENNSAKEHGSCFRPLLSPVLVKHQEAKNETDLRNSSGGSSKVKVCLSPMNLGST